MSVVFSVECEPFVPDRFHLVHVAAARARALNRGAEPRLPADGSGNAGLALREIAAGAFAPSEIGTLLRLQASPEQEPEPPPIDEQQLLDGMTASAVEVPSHPWKAVDTHME